MKILIVGDPHGVLTREFPKDVELILITGDLGKASLAKERKNLERFFLTRLFLFMTGLWTESHFILCQKMKMPTLN